MCLAGSKDTTAVLEQHWVDITERKIYVYAAGSTNRRRLDIISCSRDIRFSLSLPSVLPLFRERLTHGDFVFGYRHGAPHEK